MGMWKWVRLSPCPQGIVWRSGDIYKDRSWQHQVEQKLHEFFCKIWQDIIVEMEKMNSVSCLEKSSWKGKAQDRGWWVRSTWTELASSHHRITPTQISESELVQWVCSGWGRREHGREDCRDSLTWVWNVALSLPGWETLENSSTSPSLFLHA